MAGPAKRVAVLSPEGQFGTVDAGDVASVERAGGRVLTKKELTERALEEQYAKASVGKKIAGAVAPIAAGPIVSSALSGTGVTAVPPKVAAFEQGVSEPATLGFDQAIVKKGLETFGDKASADAYAQRQAQVAEANPGYKLAGNVVGMAAMAGVGPSGAARAIPGVGVSAIGGAVESAAANVLKNVASRGVAGRALATAGELGARGLVEGALYGGGQELASELTHDPELDADKIFAATGWGALGGGAGGAALGAAGSLLKSGVGAVAGKVAQRASGLAEREGGALAAAGEQGEANWIRGQANERAWRATGGRKAYVAEAEKYLPNGVRDVGDAMLRHGVIDAEGKLLDVGLEGTPTALAERFKEPIAAVGAKIGDITDQSGARIGVDRVMNVFKQVHDPLASKAGFDNVRKGVIDYGNELFEKLGIKPGADGVPLPGQSVSLKDMLFQRHALDELIYREGTPLNPSARIQELRNIRGGLENLITEEMDAASGQVKGELASQYRALKKDYQALKIGQKAADDAATRGVANRDFSLTDKILGSAGGAAGAAIGGPIGGLIAGAGTAAVSKVVRERADAVAAVALHRFSQSQAIARIVGKVDEQINAAAHGLLTAPPKGALPGAPPNEKPRLRAQTTMKQLAAMQADPEGTAERIARHTEEIGVTSPELAQAMTQRHVAAMSFLASKVPVVFEHDPLDPHPAPRMTDADAATFNRYAYYTEKPQRFFAEMSRGKITYEGAETAAALMPRAFAELQSRTLDAIATHMARGRNIPFQQRLRLGDVLDIPAVAAQQPAHASFLQQNVVPLPSSNKPAPAKSRAASPAKSQRSALDMLEANGPGRR